LVPAEGIEPSH